MNSDGKIHKISISENKGEKKQNINFALLKKEYGIIGDAHGGSERQVSLLPYESFDKVKNDVFVVNPGDFAENITTIGLDFKNLFIGQHLLIGDKSKLEITQIGKECHHGCIIREVVGDCIMPREGIFARVIKGGKIKVGDKMRWTKN